MARLIPRLLWLKLSVIRMREWKNRVCRQVNHPRQSYNSDPAYRLKTSLFPACVVSVQL